MEKCIADLFKKHFGREPEKLEKLPASGSARSYFRITSAGKSFVGTYHTNVGENNLFIDFSRHFAGKGLRVPEVYCVSADGTTYVQDDLGDEMLLDVLEAEREGDLLGDRVMGLYKKALGGLLEFQFVGHEGLDYSACVPRPVFDKCCMMWDLNYFKYCFLRLAGVDFSEQGLEEDFERLSDTLCGIAPDYFMFRDFQSRNVMVKEGEVWFIDYQGGRKGALQYDVASLLYDAIARMPEVQREELLDYYIEELQKFQETDPVEFRSGYYRFVLIRLLQAMGAFGLRGLHEHKQHFTDSIVPGLDNIISLFDSGKLGDDYPEMLNACRKARAIKW